MAGKKIPGWLLGCGIGCAAIVVLGIVLIVMGGLYIGNMTQGLDKAVQAGEELEKAHGAEEDFSPRPDGTIPADRMETFLAVRDALAPARESIIRSFASLPTDPNEIEKLDQAPFMEKMSAALGFGRAAFGLVTDAGEFFNVRNRSLLEKGMGMGEYTYIYTIAYYSWLGHHPQEGPGFAGEDRGDGIGSMDRRTSERINKSLLQMLRNQIASLPQEDTEWRRVLQAEIEVMEREPGRFAWVDGVPPVLAASLEPYRERLERSYTPMTNAFELARSTKMNRWSYRID